MRTFLHQLRRPESHLCAADPGVPKIKENKHSDTGGPEVGSQATVQIDTEIGHKDHFRMETSLPCQGLKWMMQRLIFN